MTRDQTAVTDVTGPDAPTPRLIVFLDGIASAFDLADTVTTIGRSRDCNVRIEHASISRHHARIHRHPVLMIEDLGSANGTAVAGTPIEAKVPLPIGSVLEIGDVRAIVAAHPTTNAMDHARTSMETAAKGSISVLVTGETGAGKEVVARAIHDRSSRSQAPFVVVNCAALPRNLLETELFGYEKGAFTGASASKKGLIEAASGGSFFLDEIGDMPIDTQAKVLRVLETREVTPVGSVQSRPVDVRFLSATHRDLSRMVKEGTFRDDLLFRISGMTIAVPSLRERASEIRAIANAILEKRSTFTPAALVLLESYRWPGNVRELKSAIERALLVAKGDTIGEGDIELHELGVSTDPPLPPQRERARIEAALDKCGGNQTEAAKLLRMSRRTLGKRLDQLGIKRPRKK